MVSLIQQPVSLVVAIATVFIMSSFCTQDVFAFAPAPSSSSNPSSDRRNVLQQITAASVAAILSANKEPALAVAPFAPIDALLPATRVKLMIDRAVDIASKLVAAGNDNVEISHAMLQDLENLLLQPQNFNRGTTPMEVPQQPAKSYLDAYADYRRSVSILEKPGALLVQKGEIDAWKRLKRQERRKEDADEIRAALNYYTSNINFNSDKFILTASKDERSKMIREDRIPDVKTVIASDMGLRYLLRNDILTACDDARAELKYQLAKETDANASDAVDGQELLDLLLVAQSACSKWFDLIDEKNVQEALLIVSKED